MDLSSKKIPQAFASQIFELGRHMVRAPDLSPYKDNFKMGLGTHDEKPTIFCFLLGTEHIPEDGDLSCGQAK